MGSGFEQRFPFISKQKVKVFKGMIRVSDANTVPSFVEKQIRGVSLSTNWELCTNTARRLGSDMQRQTR
jgi:hypothetical protein